MNNFVDAQELHRLYPNTFDIPSENELEKLKLRDIVKICLF